MPDTQTDSPETHPSPQTAVGYGGKLLLAALSVAAFALAGAGLVTAVVNGAEPARSIGLGIALAGLVGGLMTLAVVGLVMTLTAERVAAARQLAEWYGTLNGQIRRTNEQLAVIARQQLLSDRTKAIAYRANDRKAMLDAIAEESTRGDYEAALALVGEMEESFGNLAEAERTRAEISRARESNELVVIRQAREKVQALTTAEQWGEAEQLASQTVRRFPNSLIATELHIDIVNARQSLKATLTDELKACMERRDADRGVKVLEKLDKYISPEEADGLRESVRTLFVERISGLKDRFARAVQANAWAESLALADTILKEFPSSKLAQEVKGMYDSLRERTNEALVAAGDSAA